MDTQVQATHVQTTAHSLKVVKESSEPSKVEALYYLSKMLPCTAFPSFKKT